MQYPGEFDAPGCVKRKEKPWDMEYLKELENLFTMERHPVHFWSIWRRLQMRFTARSESGRSSASLQYFWLCALQHLC